MFRDGLSMFDLSRTKEILVNVSFLIKICHFRYSIFLIFNQNFSFSTKFSLVKDQRNYRQHLRILFENASITKINDHEDEGGWVETKT